MRRTWILIGFALLLLAGMTGYLAWISGTPEHPPLTGSGTLEAEEIRVAAEIPGRVHEVLVAKGDVVRAGQVLFRLDDTLLRAQQAQARAAVQAARARVQQAEKQLAVAEQQYALARQQAHLAGQDARSREWTQDQPDAFTYPAWYFTRAERLTAAQAEVEAAKAGLDEALANLDHLRKTAAAADLEAAEQRLAQARARLLAAQAALDRAEAQGDATLRDEAQARYDEALNALENAQAEYERVLSTQAAQDLQEARAAVAVAQARYDAARDHLYQLQWGDHSLNVALARAQWELAQATLEQARAALAQAQAQLDYVEAQVERLTVRAPAEGTVIALDLREGEVIPAGVPVLTIGQLDRLTITIYVPEDRLGDVALGQRALLTVDAFPGETFHATVIRIADQAEYTPRNVQTVEGRKTTVFAVELLVDDPTGRLKPGMPADVRFEAK